MNIKHFFAKAADATLLVLSYATRQLGEHIATHGESLGLSGVANTGQRLVESMDAREDRILQEELDHIFPETSAPQIPHAIMRHRGF